MTKEHDHGLGKEQRIKKTYIQRCSFPPFRAKGKDEGPGRETKDQVKLRDTLPYLALHLFVHQELQLFIALGPTSHLQIFTLKAHFVEPLSPSLSFCSHLRTVCIQRMSAEHVILNCSNF